MFKHEEMPEGALNDEKVLVGEPTKELIPTTIPHP